MVIKPKKLNTMFLESITDRYGKVDGKALTALVSFVIIVITWFFNMFLGFPVNEPLLQVFAFLVISLLGLKIVPWGKKDIQLPIQEPVVEETEEKLNEEHNG
jgi:hypothetical protein